MSDDRWAGVWLKVERAKHHITDLRLVLEAHLETRPFDLKTRPWASPEPPPSPDHWELYIANDPPPPPDEASLVVGDAIHALRTSLDYFAYRSVTRQARDTAFPSWGPERPPSIHDWRSVVRKKLPSASPSLLAEVSTLEPYLGGADEPLWWVHHLDIIDKHHLLLTTSTAMRSFQFNASAMLDGLRPPGIEAPPDFIIALKPSDLIFATQGAALLGGPKEWLENPRNQVGLRLQIAFAEPSNLVGTPLLSKIDEIAAHVEATLNRLIPLA